MFPNFGFLFQIDFRILRRLVGLDDVFRAVLDHRGQQCRRQHDHFQHPVPRPDEEGPGHPLSCVEQALRGF